MDDVFDVIVVGAGIAGLTSAAYLSNYGHRVLVCEKNQVTGGLVHSFTRNGFTFDAGIRAFENSGIVFPMLKQLGIELDLIRNPVSIGVEHEMVRLQSKSSLSEYQEMLCRIFPAEQSSIEAILNEIKMIMKYMDVIYGIDNPLFVDIAGDTTYLFKELLPWLFRYQIDIRRAQRLKLPVNEYLRRFTDNQSLIDMITQHFFKDTPTYFALSYFSLYLDYSYPIGGTGIVAKKITNLIEDGKGEIQTNTEICGIDLTAKRITSKDGRSFSYRKLIWCADMKSLYAAIDRESIGDNRILEAIKHQDDLIRQNHGGDSVLTVYVSTDLDSSYFERICGAHSFYTPHKVGLSKLGKDSWKTLLSETNQTNLERKLKLKEWIETYLSLTTYELSVPCLRDPSLAPIGKTGIIISTLMDYALVKQIADNGWYDEFKFFCQERILDVLNASIFRDLPFAKVDTLCSTPLTIERRTGNLEGAITGWMFTDHRIPAERE
ncbi:MAG: NAD(P)/FAD-dependent oxidoreductase, partial [Actinobacteria bacterium]|nr:NAD(P)/FAD-dependent oxidoreductase [Actinomycetota bacterium]